MKKLLTCEAFFRDILISKGGYYVLLMKIFKYKTMIQRLHFYEMKSIAIMGNFEHLSYFQILIFYGENFISRNMREADKMFTTFVNRRGRKLISKLFQANIIFF